MFLVANDILYVSDKGHFFSQYGSCDSGGYEQLMFFHTNRRVIQI